MIKILLDQNIPASIEVWLQKRRPIPVAICEPFSRFYIMGSDKGEHLHPPRSHMQNPAIKIITLV